MNNPEEEGSDDTNENATKTTTGNNEVIPLLDENGFPLPAEDQGSNQDCTVGGASSSSRRIITPEASAVEDTHRTLRKSSLEVYKNCNGRKSDGSFAIWPSGSSAFDLR